MAIDCRVELAVTDRADDLQWGIFATSDQQGRFQPGDYDRIYPMGSKQAPPAAIFVVPALVLSIIGFLGLYWVIRYTLPTVGFRWIFFFLLPFAISGPLMPVVAFLHRRFPGDPPARVMTVIREALIVGIYISTLAWLQLARVLSPLLSIGLLVIFVFIGIATRVWEKARWDPKDSIDGEPLSGGEMSRNP